MILTQAQLPEATDCILCKLYARNYNDMLLCSCTFSFGRQHIVLWGSTDYNKSGNGQTCEAHLSGAAAVITES